MNKLTRNLPEGERANTPSSPPSGAHVVQRALGISVRAHRLPIVDVTYGCDVKPHHLDFAFQQYAALSRRGGALAYLIDLRQFNPVMASATMRKHAADLFQLHVPVLRQVTVCEARILSNPLTRGIVTAFDWLTGSKWPCANFTSPVEAEAWVLEQLATVAP